MLSLLWPIKIFSFPIITQWFYTDTSVLSSPSYPGAPALPGFTLPVQTHLLPTSAHTALVSSFALVPEQDSFSPPSTHVAPVICKVLIFPSNAPWNLPSQPLLLSLSALNAWRIQSALHNWTLPNTITIHHCFTCFLLPLQFHFLNKHLIIL